MTEYRPSIVEYFSERSKSICGYCKSKDGSVSYGLNAHTLRVEDYQNMIDRGWRRSGHYCYKALMDVTCCPFYTIRCGATDFRLSKSQKRVLKRFNNFLINGTITKDKCTMNKELPRVMEVFHSKHENKIGCENFNMMAPNLDASIGDNMQVEPTVQIRKDEKSNSSDTIEPPKEKICKNKCNKAKYLRIERKKQKLQKLGLSEEEISKKLIEKKKYPVIKTIEDYLSEPLSKNKAHDLRISLVRSSPRSAEFDNTCAVTFDLYKRYQMCIHKDPPEKLTKSQFERFLVTSPLQIHLVLVKSPEFEKSFKESASLFAKYQKAVHNDDDCDVLTFHNFLVDSPLEASKDYGSYHQQYWLDNKLIAVGVIDILPKCVSSVYFFYDPDYSHLCLGTYAALSEIAFTRELSSRLPDLVYYYMGFYIHSCVKMKYKAAFKPSYLLCPEVYTWHPIERCLPKIKASKYSRLNEDPEAKDNNSDISDSDVLILHNRVVMRLNYYLKKKKSDREEVMEYARLVGKTCSKNMVLYRI